MSTSTVKTWASVGEALSREFDQGQLEWKPCRFGKKKNGQGWAQMLVYVTNRAIMDRLDEVCGAGNWRNEFTPWGPHGALCGISIRVTHGDMPESLDDWVTKFDGADNSDIEPTKGGLSNSMKRAAVQWGIGRYLYDADSTLVDAEIWEKNGKLTGKPTGKPVLKFKDNGRDHSAGGARPEPSAPPAPDQAPSGGVTPTPAGEPLTTGEPRWIDETLGFGKHKDETWRDMASGSEGGARESYLLYCLNKFDDGVTKKRIQGMLAWRRENVK